MMVKTATLPPPPTPFLLDWTDLYWDQTYCSAQPGQNGANLANPQLAWHSYRQEPVAFTRSYPSLFRLQRRYEAIRVWSYTTFIVIEAVVNRKLAVET